MFGLSTSLLIRGLAALALAGAITGAYFAWRNSEREIGRDEIRAEWQADKLARAESSRLLLMANAKASSDLQAAADKERKALHEKNRDIGRQLADSLERLRNRPERPADRGDGVPAVAGAGAAAAGCTGAELHRQDAEFLVRESARADQLRVALQSCRAGYQDAVDALDKARGAGG